MRSRRGFTLIELLVVAVVGVLLLLATYQVLIVNQRTYTVQNAQVRAQQATRASLDVLFTELREVSSRGGDILSFSADSLTVRVMRSYGVVCDPYRNATEEFRVNLLAADSFAVGDSVWIYADNREAVVGDDAWVNTDVTAVTNGVACPDGSGAQDVTLGNAAAALAADSVRAGAPLRRYETYTYGSYQEDGEWYLARKLRGGDWTPLVGPLTAPSAAPPGLAFTYLDEDGVVTAVATDIREIQVTIRADSPARGYDEDVVRDSISASIYTRN